MKKLLLAAMFMTAASMAHASSAASEFLGHTLGLNAEQMQSVSKVLSENHAARRAIRTSGNNTCEANLKLRNSTRDKMAAILTPQQLTKYDEYQNRRYRNASCN